MNNIYKTDFKHNDTDDGFDIKKEFFKYFYYWKYFLISTILFVIVAFTYLRYSPKVFSVSAKIQIIDKKESSLELPSAAELFSNSKINLENEIEVLKSYPILEEVILNKNLHTSVITIGNIKQTLTVDYPFQIKLNLPVDSLSEKIFRLNMTKEGFEIIDYQENSNTYAFKGNSSLSYKHDLPFEIFNFNKKKFLKINAEGFEIQFSSIGNKVETLKKEIEITQVGKDSDIIKLDFASTNSRYSEIVLNELINVFNNDGVKDRQLIHKRTIDFVNDRYAYLSLELDSIEIAKQLYKADNNLVDLSTNSVFSLEKSFKSEEDIFSLENQISITNLLISTLTNDEIELLPANMVIENEEINVLISNYNQAILERKKLILSAGSNNPSTKQLNISINDFRSNIIFSLQNHLKQLTSIKNKLTGQFYKYNDEVSNLPEKEKILRSIERNQKIKEALYLFLLQKREESEVSYAVTEPSIKIVENAVTNNKPISPNLRFIYLTAILTGLIFPFIVIYLLFLFNRKIYSKNQIDELNLPIPVIGEIPAIKDQSNTTINSSSERSPLAESFRVFCSKLKFFMDNDKKDANVIMITSTIKGEGKTFCAMNLAYTKSTLGNKVLLIGADLHNPQIHTYVNVEKDNEGLVNFLVDKNFDWKKALIKPNSISHCDILIGGQIPPNPAQLLNSGNFEKLINEAKKTYDFIIVDTPPCLLVSDTVSISNFADLLLFVIRCNHTDIDVLDFFKDSFEKGIIKENSMIILNGIGATNKYGYGYSYNYSYGYKYSYNYNYGYGYEYKSD